MPKQAAVPDPGPITQAGGGPSAASGPARKSPAKLPLIGGMPFEKQLQTVITVSLILIALTALFTWLGVRNARVQSDYATAVAQMQFHSQRLAKAADAAAQGSEAAFTQVLDSQLGFNFRLTALRSGGAMSPPSGESVEARAGAEVPAAGGSATEILEGVANKWAASDKAVGELVAAKNDLLSIGQGVGRLSKLSRDVARTAGELLEHLQSSGAAPGQLLAAARLSGLAERIARAAADLQGGDAAAQDTVILLDKDLKSARATLQALDEGGEGGRVPPVREGDGRNLLAKIKDAFTQIDISTAVILRNAQQLTKARAAAATVLAASEPLQLELARLSDAFRDQRSRRWTILAVVGGLLTLGALYVGASAVIADARSREARSQAENRRNQEAILRLLNEMGDLADGDLTVRAKVTEDITGAVADSLNYTIDELSSLVTGVNRAASQVAERTQEARQVSEDLIAAAQRQSQEIEATSARLLEVSQVITEVAANASESSKVAERSLVAAEKGQTAVQNSIAGMNDIREQIQETSKRIKRLGESSQEIGEIVELISDITEQTNVLALNAAIQAATAGEAGRGFSVVAEEVQRLAERSAEATKQIGTIVKTIQSDTKDAVAAMEKSTQGVVEGAKLSDAAGQALTEIGDVARQLASLIQSYARQAQDQAASTMQVADSMQGILEITKDTTVGTQMTAASIQNLSEVANELKNSISGFRL